MAGDDRDPTACCLLYFALGKVKLVHGLWKQAVWHPEQQVMLKFLSNNFDEHRWRTAALKNAFALMSKQRFGSLARIDSPAKHTSTDIFIGQFRICCRLLCSRKVIKGRRERMPEASQGLPACCDSC